MSCLSSRFLTINPHPSDDHCRWTGISESVCFQIIECFFIMSASVGSRLHHRGTSIVHWAKERQKIKTDHSEGYSSVRVSDSTDGLEVGNKDVNFVVFPFSLLLPEGVSRLFVRFFRLCCEGKRRVTSEDQNSLRPLPSEIRIHRCTGRFFVLTQ